MQHSHHGLHVRAAEDEGGAGDAERPAQIVGRRADGRATPVQGQSGHLGYVTGNKVCF